MCAGSMTPRSGRFCGLVRGTGTTGWGWSSVRALGALTEKWQSEASDTPKRNLHDIHAIAEIVSRFDVVAIQEAREDLTALRRLMQALGPSWGLILTDVTWGEPGNGERLAFVFDMRRVKPSGLACELVVPAEWLAESEEDARENDKIRMDGLYKQFARTPYAVSFESAGQTFVLVALHVWYGKKATEREPELRAIAEWLSRWSSRGGPYEQNFIALGDFNIDRKGDPNWEAFASHGLRAPAELDEALRTISDQPGDPNFYDQIAWFHENGKAKLSLEYTGRAGSFDWTQHVLQGVGDTEKSWRISDHFPLWRSSRSGGPSWPGGKTRAKPALACVSGYRPCAPLAPLSHSPNRWATR